VVRRECRHGDDNDDSAKGRDRAMRLTYDALKGQLRYAKYRLFGYSTSSPSGDEWDQEYSAGRWQHLSGLDELAHYSAILGYVWFFRSNSILDVACGEGVLTRILHAIPYESYHGVDVSAYAIAAAEANYGRAGTRFFCAEAETFQPERFFDTIIFNECLYYFQRPQAIVRRYREFLEPGGRMIISTFVSGQERALLRLIETEATMLDLTTVTNQKGQRWIVSVFEKSARPPTLHPANRLRGQMPLWRS
jgi:2-polyprenyl-3-methyl-5-hydroxy-6-metoxy-1,4-benzoquinol methylase